MAIFEWLNEASQLGLTLKMRNGCGFTRQPCSQNLDRDRAFQHGIVRSQPSMSDARIRRRSRMWMAVKTEESKASIRQYRTHFLQHSGIPLYNSAHFFPNSAAIFSAIIIVGALVFPLGMVGM